MSAKKPLISQFGLLGPLGLLGLSLPVVLSAVFVSLRTRTLLTERTRRQVHVRSVSEGDALELLGLKEHELEPQRLRQLFRAEVRQMHPDQGGDPEVFKQLLEAYTVLRRSLRRTQGAVLSAQKAAREKWKKWEDEVEGGQELAQEGDVVHWRSARDEAWQLAARLKCDNRRRARPWS